MIYVEELIGPDTVNTMPRETVEAFQDHGEVERDARRSDVDGARARARRRSRRPGIDYDDVVDTLEREGVEKFAKSFQELFADVEAKRDAAGGRLMGERTDFRRELGQQLRVDSVRSSAAAGSGHPTSSMSAADLMAVLLDGHLRLDYQNPQPGQRPPDLLQGPRVAAVLRDAQGGRGIDDAELLTFRKLGSRLEGHPTPRIPPTDVATGSLGQGLPIAVGVALAGKRLDRLPYRVWCLCGDSEMAEGSMWEAFQHAGWEGLDNLIAIIDVNRLGPDARDDARLGPRRLRAPRSRRSAGTRSRSTATTSTRSRPPTTRPRRTGDRPTAIIARTKKGKGVKAVEDQPGKHGKPLDDPDAAIAGARRRARPARSSSPSPPRAARRTLRRPRRRAPDVGARRGGRHAQGVRRGPGGARLDPRRRRRARRRGLQLDALGGLPRRARGPLLRDVHRRAAAGRGGGRHPGRAAGCRSRRRSRRSSRARTTSSAWRRSRARTSGSSGSHAGVSIGEDGPSQMALEDIASFRAIHGSTVLHPCDANQAAELVAEMADTDGIVVPAHAARQDAGAHAGGRGVRDRRQPRRVHDGDDVAIVACGITVDEAVAGGRDARGRGHQCARARLLLDQADRRRRRAGRGARLRGDRSPSRTTGPRAASATPCSRRSPKPTTGRRSPSSPSARCRAPARPRSCCTRPGSTRRRSPPPHAGNTRPGRGSLAGFARGRNPLRGTIRARSAAPCGAGSAAAATVGGGIGSPLSACAAANGMSCLHFVPRAGSVSVFR